MSRPDVWLRGPVVGVPGLLQPVSHALLQALEDVERVMVGFSDQALWQRPGQAASVGFHLKHLIGATDRLLSYARGASLTEAQKTWLMLEPRDGDGGTDVAGLVSEFRAVIEAGLRQIATTDPGSLAQPLLIGRAGLATTVGGCLFHAAEHASRHAGQLITTVKALAR